jgi:hypothetical protein
MVALLEDKYKA